MAQADSAYRESPEALSQFFLRNQDGGLTPLSNLTEVKLIENAPLISHFNLFRSATINGEAASGKSSGDAIRALEEVAKSSLPSGYSFEYSGITREEVATGSSTYLIFALSVIFVFLCLTALYESWSVPFSVLMAVPTGAFGAIITLLLIPRLENNVYAQIGLLTLIGLAAKNAILIVEYAKERVDDGMGIKEAVVEASKIRLRPIIMTSLAFILGIMPLMFAGGAGALARQTIGWTVFGGMTTATLMTIFIVPVLFVLITGWAYSEDELKKLKAKNES